MNNKLILGVSGFTLISYITARNFFVKPFVIKCDPTCETINVTHRNNIFFDSLSLTRYYPIHDMYTDENLWFIRHIKPEVSGSKLVFINDVKKL